MARSNSMRSLTVVFLGGGELAHDEKIKSDTTARVEILGNMKFNLEKNERGSNSDELLPLSFLTGSMPAALYLAAGGTGIASPEA